MRQGQAEDRREGSVPRLGLAAEVLTGDGYSLFVEVLVGRLSSARLGHATPALSRPPVVVCPAFLSRFLAAFMQMGQLENVRILDSASVELMTTIQYPEIASHQGLFWQREYLNDRLLWGHHGARLGVNTNMHYCSDENSGVIVLTNGNEEIDFFDTIVQELFEFAAKYTTSIAERTDITSL